MGVYRPCCRERPRIGRGGSQPCTGLWLPLVTLRVKCLLPLSLRPLTGTFCKALLSACLSFSICTKRVLIKGHWNDSNEIKITLVPVTSARSSLCSPREKICSR